MKVRNSDTRRKRINNPEVMEIMAPVVVG